MDYYKNYIKNILAFKEGNYDDLEINKIIFSYGIREGLAPSNPKITLGGANPWLGKSILQSPFFPEGDKHYKLPITMDPIQYGNIINVFDSDTSYVIQAANGNVYNIKISENNLNSFKTNNIKVFRNGILTLSYTDTQVADNKFIRTINNNKYHYTMDGELEFRIILCRKT